MTVNKEIEELLNKIKQQFIIDEKFAKDFHKTTLNYEETKLLLSYIEQLQTTAKDCKQKLDQYENPDDLTLFYMWLDEKAKDKMKQLENNRDKAIEYIEIGLSQGGERELRDLVDGYEVLKLLKGDSDE